MSAIEEIEFHLERIVELLGKAWDDFACEKPVYWHPGKPASPCERLRGHNGDCHVEVLSLRRTEDG